jgi:hypothetical protein
LTLDQAGVLVLHLLQNFFKMRVPLLALAAVTLFLVVAFTQLPLFGVDGESSDHTGKPSDGAGTIAPILVPLSPPYTQAVTTIQRVTPAAAAIPDAQQGGICPASKAFQPLGNFTFWGKPATVASTCQTSGLNNQLSLWLAIWHCHERRYLTAKRNESTQERRELDVPFRWKDISCAPTGGKDAGSKFQVGSADYEYAWFRWSEIFEIVAPRGTASYAPLCLADHYTWSEGGAEQKKCPPSLGKAGQGTPLWWDLRGRLQLRDHILNYARCTMLGRCGGEEDDLEAAAAGNATAMMPASVGKTLGIHVRRGDYKHFCEGLMGTRGVRAFRTVEFHWLQGKTRSLGRKTMDTCAPSDELVLEHVATFVRRDPTITRVAIVTNSAAFETWFRRRVAEVLPGVAVVSTQNMPSYWPPAVRPHATPASATDEARTARVSEIERSWVDIATLALSDVMVLNRYSTFSGSAVNERVLDAVRRGLLDPNDITPEQRAALNVWWW